MRLQSKQTVPVAVPAIAIIRSQSVSSRNHADVTPEGPEPGGMLATLRLLQRRRALELQQQQRDTERTTRQDT
jgi:hypothetical protein